MNSILSCIAYIVVYFVRKTKNFYTHAMNIYSRNYIVTRGGGRDKWNVEIDWIHIF